VQTAEIVRRKEVTPREKLRPGIETLKQKLAAQRGPHDTERRALIKESIAVGEAWLSLPATLHRKLMQLAAERRAAAEEIRRARPIGGDVNYAELSREHIARYPKSELHLPRAALAK
jgi:hypothetical protein